MHVRTLSPLRPCHRPLLAMAVAMVGVAALLFLTAAIPGVALARPLCPVCGAPDKVTVSGPGLAGSVEVTNSDVLQALGEDVFLGFAGHREPVAPPQVATGYELARYYNMVGGVFDRLRFYVGSVGQASYLFYIGPANNSESQQMAQALGVNEYVGKWYKATPAEEAAMRRLLGTLNAMAQATASPRIATVPTSPEQQSSLLSVNWILPLLLGAVALLAAGILARGTARRYLRAHQ